MAAALMVATAGTTKADDKAADAAKPPEPIVTEHEVRIGGQPVKYRATAGRLPLKEDPTLKTKAEVFFVAYERLSEEDRTTRPITFAFNGGPGSSSVWLHMGALGPRRVQFGPEGEPPAPPGKVIDNEYSWLDTTDLVFIDPVSTGYSRPAEGQDAGAFHSLEGDIQSVGEFIRLYTTKNGRWLSPKFLAGESYGTTRAAGLATFLQNDLGIYLNGIVLISPALNFQCLDFDTGNDTPYWLYIPSYAATAWYHKKLSPELQSKTLDEVVALAEVWAGKDYLSALGKGDAISAAEHAATAEQLAKFTGLSREFVEQNDLRVHLDRFRKELLRDQRLTVGRLDSRYTGRDRDEGGANSEFDPSYSVILGPFTATLNHYVREELRYQSDLSYEILTGKVHPWKFQENRYTEVAERLRRGMTQNPALRVMVCMGHYDLATPPFAGDYTLTHMQVDPTLKDHVVRKHYASGHMMYIRQQDLEQLKKDAVEFIHKP
jgi:carboxypeptidase C (cathepsin A)